MWLFGPFHGRMSTNTGNGGDLLNTSQGDVLTQEYLMNDHEVLKNKEANVEKAKGVVVLEDKDKYIEERRQDLIDEDGSWIKVAFKFNRPRYQKEKVHEHHGQERGSSSKDPMGLSLAHYYDQWKILWQGSQYKQSNHGTKPFNLSFNKNGKTNLPL